MGVRRCHVGLVDWDVVGFRLEKGALLVAEEGLLRRLVLVNLKLVASFSRRGARSGRSLFLAFLGSFVVVAVVHVGVLVVDRVREVVRLEGAERLLRWVHGSIRVVHSHGRVVAGVGLLSLLGFATRRSALSSSWGMGL